MAEITGIAARAPAPEVKASSVVRFSLVRLFDRWLVPGPVLKNGPPTMLTVIPAEAKRRAGIQKLDMAGFPLSRE
jgi:hypothetical protein